MGDVDYPGHYGEPQTRDEMLDTAVRRPGDVPVQLDNQNDLIAAISQCVAELGKRLSPVLRGDDFLEKGDTPHDTMAPLAEAIYQNNVRLESSNRSLRSLLERLEL